MDHSATNGHARTYKYVGLITVLYVTMQLVSDVTAGKIISLFGHSVSITVLYFPITYIFGDILTEVYGYARSRAVLWTVLMASVIAGVLYQLVVYLPPSLGFDANDAYARVFGVVPRVLIGGWLAVFAGEIANSFVLAKMKILTSGRLLWTRTITSTIVGQLLNTTVFYVVALSGILPPTVLVDAILTGWILKTAIEAIMTPLTYMVVGRLKLAEREDFYDRGTNFNPLIINRPF